MAYVVGILIVAVAFLGWLLLRSKEERGVDKKEIEVLLDEKNIIAENKKKTWANQDIINKLSDVDLKLLRKQWTRKGD